MRRIQRSIGECIAPAEFARVGPEDSVAEAVAAMTRLKTTSVLVIEEDALVGIFTERDFLTRVAAEHRDPATTRMRAVMSQPVVTLSEDDCVSYAINHMAEGNYRHIPVVGSGGRPISVLDVRLVMLHLVKVFAELEQEGGEEAEEWIDLGGGG